MTASLQLMSQLASTLLLYQSGQINEDALREAWASMGIDVAAAELVWKQSKAAMESTQPDPPT